MYDLAVPSRSVFRSLALALILARASCLKLKVYTYTLIMCYVRAFAARGLSLFSLSIPRQPLVDALRDMYYKTRVLELLSFQVWSLH